VAGGWRVVARRRGGGNHRINNAPTQHRPVDIISTFHPFPPPPEHPLADIQVAFTGKLKFTLIDDQQRHPTVTDSVLPFH